MTYAMKRRNFTTKFTAKDIVLLVLVSLLDGRAGARIILSIAKRYLREMGEVQRAKRLQMDVLRVTLHRLQNAKLVVNDRHGLWHTTTQGVAYAALLERHRLYAEFRERNKGKQPDTVIVFDVPERERWKRRDLRVELVALDYMPLQKSVWFGRGPLPEVFIRQLHTMRLLPCIHIFSVKDAGTIAGMA